MNTNASPESPGQPESPEQIEHDISATRANVDRTIDALIDKVSPGRLVDQSIEVLKDRGGEAARSIGRVVRDNPVPAALIGIGLVWLGASARSTAASNSGDSRPEGDRVAAAADTVREKAGALAGSARQTGAAAGRSATRVMRENPMATGALVVLLGAAFAAALPGTRRENEVMGGTADTVKQAARDAAEEQARRATAVAQSAVEGAKRAAVEEFDATASDTKNDDGETQDEPPRGQAADSRSRKAGPKPESAAHG